MSAQIAFPWADETPAKRRAVKCDYFDLLSAYCRVQRRFEARMADLAAADAQE